MIRTHPRGYSLVQMLAVIMALPVLFMIMDKMFCEIVLDLPKSTQVADQHERLLLCLEYLEKDLAEAVALPQTFGSWHQDENTLLIKLPDSLVAYVHDEKGVARHILEPDGPDVVGSWSMPQASIQWTLLPDLSQATRVQVNTSVLHTRRKQQQLKNPRLFYVGVDSVRGGAQ